MKLLTERVSPIHVYLIRPGTTIYVLTSNTSNGCKKLAQRIVNTFGGVEAHNFLKFFC
jgi:hypothetical protein